MPVRISNAYILYAFSHIVRDQQYRLFSTCLIEIEYQIKLHFEYRFNYSDLKYKFKYKFTQCMYNIQYLGDDPHLPTL